MYKSYFGRNGQVRFSSPKEYYELLGYLAKSDGLTSLTWENNEDQGAWGSEGRICFHTRMLPPAGHLRFYRREWLYLQKGQLQRFRETYLYAPPLCTGEISRYCLHSLHNTLAVHLLLRKRTEKLALYYDQG